jgi:ApaG protein
MPMQKSVSVQFEISAYPQYVSEESNPEQNYYFFSYKISIKNKGSEPAQLMSRHWVITDSTGHTEEVKGPGVVGLQPKIQPGQSFEYESACPLTTPTGSMKGSYNLMTENGDNLQIDIPEFYLVCPEFLH